MNPCSFKRHSQLCGWWRRDVC